MKIFISHPFKDEDLALRLKKILESSKEIKEAYIAQRSPNYELEISHKITAEIIASDYLIAIITNKTNESTSVHQELGFAQGVKTPKIPLIEKNAKKGVLLEGRESIDFERGRFDEACNAVLEYILKKGPTKKAYSQEEEVFVQKSAHFRFNLEYEVLHFISSLLILLKITSKNEHVFLNEEGREKANSILQNFIDDKEKMTQKIKKLQLRNLISLYSDFNLLRRNIKDIERFPNSNLFLEEEDAIVKLNERMLEVDTLDIEEYLKTTLQSRVDYDSSLHEIIEQHEELPSLPMYLASYALDLRTVIKPIISLNNALLKIKKKFGDLAFKDTFDYESV